MAGAMFSCLNVGVNENTLPTFVFIQERVFSNLADSAILAFSSRDPIDGGNELCGSFLPGSSTKS